MSTPTSRISHYYNHTTFDNIWLLCLAHGEINSSPFCIYDSGITAKDHPPAAASDPDLITANTSELSVLHDTGCKLFHSFPSLNLSAGKTDISPRTLLCYLERLQIHPSSVASHNSRDIRGQVMQSHQDRRDYPTAEDPSFSSPLSSGGETSTDVSVLESYIPPNVPHGLPHVVRFATLSSMDLPLEVRFLIIRFLIIMIDRFADVHGVASVANSTLCEICRIGPHHTVERWISLTADAGILRKEPGKGGKDRKSNSFTLLGVDRDWAPLPVGRPDTNPIVALAHARFVIEQLMVKAARVDDLEAETDLLRTELALLRNGHTSSYYGVTNGEDEPPAGPPGDSYETADSRSSQEAYGAIGHPRVTMARLISRLWRNWRWRVTAHDIPEQSARRKIPSLLDSTARGRAMGVSDD